VCHNEAMDKFDQVFEQIKVTGQDLADRIKELIHEGNVRRIIVKDERGHTFMEIPVTVAAVGVIAAPILAAAAAIATMVAKFTIVVERNAPAPAGSGPEQTTSTVTDPSVGATEDQVNMAAEVPEHPDDSGVKPEDIAGTGVHDSLGG